MKIQANTMRSGMVIEHQGKQWTVLKIQLLQPGKGGAFIQVEMRDVATGTKSQDRWRTADTVERLEVRELDCQFLFKDGDAFTFMDTGTYDQFNVPGELLGEKAAFLQDNMEVTVNFIEGKAVLTNEDGRRWTLKAGDGFLIPPGFKGTWETVEKVRKHYVILMPKD